MHVEVWSNHFAYPTVSSKYPGFHTGVIDAQDYHMLSAQLECRLREYQPAFDDLRKSDTKLEAGGFHHSRLTDFGVEYKHQNSFLII